jgi:ABC-type sugar transport systems, permease components
MNIKTSKKFSTALQFFVYTAPAIIAITAFVGIPFLTSIFYSFRSWNGIDKNSAFIGLNNYIRLFTDDKAFVHSIFFTFIYAFFVVILVNVLALLFAQLLESKIRAKGLFRTAFYLPNIISLVVIGFIWKFIFTRVFDQLATVTSMKFFELSWLGDPKLAIASVIFVSVWQSLGFYMVIYIAGLQSVPEDIGEAAMIDGAGSFRKFFRITLPMIMPSISFCMFYSVANSMKMFDLIFSLTSGGPGAATTPMSLEIYNTAFGKQMMGYGSAKSVILFIIVAAISIIQINFFKSKEVES